MLGRFAVVNLMESSPSSHAEPLEAAQLARISAELAAQWERPWAKDRPHLRLLPVGPGEVHAYWELKPENIKGQGVNMARHHGRYVLRMRPLEVDARCGGAFEVEAQGLRAERRVKLAPEVRAVRAELGLHKEGEGFVALAHSEAVRLPGPAVWPQLPALPEERVEPLAVRRGDWPENGVYYDEEAIDRIICMQLCREKPHLRFENILTRGYAEAFEGGLLTESGVGGGSELGGGA